MLPHQPWTLQQLPNVDPWQVTPLPHDASVLTLRPPLGVGDPEELGVGGVPVGVATVTPAGGHTVGTSLLTLRYQLAGSSPRQTPTGTLLNPLAWMDLRKYSVKL